MLIYLKASMTGHEDTWILQYHASPTGGSRTRPRAISYYGEDQFESYRSLGSARSPAEPLATPRSTNRRIGAPTTTWSMHRGEAGGNTCSPNNGHGPDRPGGRITGHTERLMKLWDKSAEIREREGDLRGLDQGVLAVPRSHPTHRLQSDRSSTSAPR